MNIILIDPKDTDNIWLVNLNSKIKLGYSEKSAYMFLRYEHVEYPEYIMDIEKSTSNSKFLLEFHDPSDFKILLKDRPQINITLKKNLSWAKIGVSKLLNVMENLLQDKQKFLPLGNTNLLVLHNETIIPELVVSLKAHSISKRLTSNGIFSFEISDVSRISKFVANCRNIPQIELSDFISDHNIIFDSWPFYLKYGVHYFLKVFGTPEKASVVYRTMCAFIMEVENDTSFHSYVSGYLTQFFGMITIPNTLLFLSGIITIISLYKIYPTIKKKYFDFLKKKQLPPQNSGGQLSQIIKALKEANTVMTVEIPKYNPDEESIEIDKNVETKRLAFGKKQVTDNELDEYMKTISKEMIDFARVDNFSADSFEIFKDIVEYWIIQPFAMTRLMMMKGVEVEKLYKSIYDINEEYIKLLGKDNKQCLKIRYFLKNPSLIVIAALKKIDKNKSFKFLNECAENREKEFQKLAVNIGRDSKYDLLLANLIFEDDFTLGLLNWDSLTLADKILKSQQELFLCDAHIRRNFYSLEKTEGDEIFKFMDYYVSLLWNPESDKTIHSNMYFPIDGEYKKVICSPEMFKLGKNSIFQFILTILGQIFIDPEELWIFRDLGLGDFMIEYKHNDLIVQYKMDTFLFYENGVGSEGDVTEYYTVENEESNLFYSHQNVRFTKLLSYFAKLKYNPKLEELEESEPKKRKNEKTEF